MSSLDALDITKLLSGPDLLRSNAFRLAQMPVDASERQLNKRQLMVATAKKMNMSPPAGAFPIFSVDGAESEAVLKEALHRMRDPVNRLFNELLWFWPRSFGRSSQDEGLALLANDRVEEAIKYWERGERETENFVSTHNLALIHQLLALQVEENLLDSRSSGWREERKARKHWKESFNRWLLLKNQDNFWHFLKSRIRSLRDPRLPEDSVDWFRQHISSILLSINAGLILKAAETDLRDYVVRQRKILQKSGFEHDEIDRVIQIFTRKYHIRIQHLCKSTEDETTRDPVGAAEPIRQLAKQTTPILRLLSCVYPDGDKNVSSLHDDVALRILNGQVIYGRKTHDWVTSEKLLKLAVPIAKGSTTLLRVTETIQQVQENKEAGNDWCENGYFDLPEECIELLEKARDYGDAQLHEDAITLLRKALLGLVPLPEDGDFLRHLRHAIAYCFKSKAIVTYNKGHERLNAQILKILTDSITCDGAVTESYATCACCGGNISGSYVQRTIQGHLFPICNNCDRPISSRIGRCQSEINDVTKEALDLMIISEAFDPNNKNVVRNINVIRETANENSIAGSELVDLRIEWNLIESDEAIEILSSGHLSDDHQLFQNLLKIIVSWDGEKRWRILGALFNASEKSQEVCSRFLSLFVEDDYILNEFVRHYFAGGKGESSSGRALVVKVLLTMDYESRFAVVKQITLFCDGPNDVADKILLSLNKTVEKLVGELNPTALSFISGQLGEILGHANHHSQTLEQQLIRRIIVSASKSSEKARSIVRAVSEADKVKETFLEVLDSSASELTLTGRRQYYLVLVSHWEEDVRLKALKWILANINDPETVVKVLITALADRRIPVRSFAHTHLLDFPNEAVMYLLEAAYTTSRTQLAEIWELLGELRQRVSWKKGCRPSLRSLICICLTVKDPGAVNLARGLVYRLYPSWFSEKEIKACIPWLKFAAKTGRAKALLSDRTSSLANEMLDRIKRCSFGERLSVWLAKTEKATPDHRNGRRTVRAEGAGSVTEWWATEHLENPQDNSSKVKDHKIARTDIDYKTAGSDIKELIAMVQRSRDDRPFLRLVWYAKRGDEGALFEMAMILLEDLSIDINVQVGRRLLEEAARKGSQSARDHLKRIKAAR